MLYTKVFSIVNISITIKKLLEKFVCSIGGIMLKAVALQQGFTVVRKYFGNTEH